MNIPGFSADVSLYKTTQFYSMATTIEALEVRSKLYLQRVGLPGGPIGLPGQDCLGACLHMCSINHPPTRECLEMCSLSCSGTPGGLTRI